MVGVITEFNSITSFSIIIIVPSIRGSADDEHENRKLNDNKIPLNVCMLSSL